MPPTNQSYTLGCNKEPPEWLQELICENLVVTNNLHPRKSFNKASVCTYDGIVMAAFGDTLVYDSEYGIQVRKQLRVELHPLWMATHSHVSSFSN